MLRFLIRFLLPAIFAAVSAQATAGWNGDTGTGFVDPGFMVNSNLHVTGLTGHPKDEGTGLTSAIAQIETQKLGEVSPISEASLKQNAQMHDMQARYYDPVIGRFLSVDPVTILDTGAPSMFNRCAYVGNDPINGIDPDGRCGPVCYDMAQQEIELTKDMSTQELRDHYSAQAGVIADFTPVVGSIKGAYEFSKDPTPMNAVGIIPYGKIQKRGD